MRRAAVLVVFLGLACSAAFAADPTSPLLSLPTTPSLDPAAMDPSVDPCVDFYAYSCGGWQKANPIPADQSSWSVYGKAHNDNLALLWGLLEQAAKASADAPGQSPEERQIGDAYAACMDEPAIEKAGLAPLQPQLAAIAALRSTKGIGKLLASLHLTTQGNGLLFGFGSTQDFGDANSVIGYLGAGGLGLPDRDYYFKDDEKSKETRARYVEHVAAMLRLLGEDARAAAAGAAAVMRLETELAKVSLTRVERRDPYKTYHKMSRRQAEKLAPRLGLREYLAGVGLASIDTLNVAQPKFIERAGQLLRSEPLSTWKSYLRWQLVNAKAQNLSRAFSDRDFDFYRKYLRGTERRAPRWKECVQTVDRDFGEALGKVYVDKAFAPHVKADVLRMVEFVGSAMKTRIDALPWMGEATRKQALEKLAGLRNKIGYPDSWRDYSSIAVRRDDHFGNAERATAFESRRQLRKIGQPVDRGEWGMTPPTVNAYYDPQMNDMNFPAGVLQPPLYDPRSDDAPNYGNTGSTIGHELIHGFDDEGRQFDAKGNLRDWWTEADAEEFEKRVACVADQYAQYTIVDDLKINSKLTLGEDVADLAGTIVSYEAWRLATAGKTLEPRDGLTPEQRFFVGFAQWDCANYRPEALRLSALTNPHSPARYRINGVVVNMPEFARAFACQAGQPMVRKPEEICRIW